MEVIDSTELPLISTLVPNEYYISIIIFSHECLDAVSRLFTT